MIGIFPEVIKAIKEIRHNESLRSGFHCLMKAIGCLNACYADMSRRDLDNKFDEVFIEERRNLIDCIAYIIIMIEGV